MSTPEHSQETKSNKRALGGWIASGWGLFIVVLLGAWFATPDALSSAGASLPARLIFALTHIFCASTLLFLGFLAVGATRWKLETDDATINPAVSGGEASRRSLHNRVHTQFLSNTTEQFVMFSAATLAASPFLTAPYLKLITVTTVLWIVGRFFFWGGYWYTTARGQPTYPRAVGLGMGLLCTLLMAAVAAAGICLHYPSFAHLTNAAAKSSAASGKLLIQPAAVVAGSNLLPVCFFSILAGAIGALAFFPRLAPPVIPIAAITIVGWVWALASGVVPVRL